MAKHLLPISPAEAVRLSFTRRLPCPAPPSGFFSFLSPFSPQSRGLFVAAVSSGRHGRPSGLGLVINEGRDDEDVAISCLVCPGCGVFMQDVDPNLPGFFKNPSCRSQDEMGEDEPPVIVMVVDCSYFYGSFPKRASKSLFKALEGWGNSKLSETPRLVLVGTKVDLLPWEQMDVRLDRWVCGRVKAFGAPKLDAVFLVSVHKDLAVRNLLSYIKESAGPRSNVWVIGAQNAGKSTLINGFTKKQGVKITRLTEAAVPGTTLGILRITEMYDTPGLLHPYIMAMRLNEERKMIEINK